MNNPKPMTEAEQIEFLQEQVRMLRLRGCSTIHVCQCDPEKLQIRGWQGGQEMMSVEMIRSIYLSLLAGSQMAAACPSGCGIEQAERIASAASILAELLRDIDQLILDGVYDDAK